MKRLIAITSIVLFASCKKEYTCETTTYEFGELSSVTTRTVEAKNRTDANWLCIKNDYPCSHWGYGYCVESKLK